MHSLSRTILKSIAALIIRRRDALLGCIARLCVGISVHGELAETVANKTKIRPPVWWKRIIGRLRHTLVQQESSATPTSPVGEIVSS